LYRFTVVPFYCCTVLLLYRFTVVQFYCCTVLLLYSFTVVPFRAIRRYFKTLRTPGSKVLPDMLLVLLVVDCG